VAQTGGLSYRYCTVPWGQGLVSCPVLLVAFAVCSPPQMPPRFVHTVDVPLMPKDRERYDALHTVAQTHFAGE
jgi:hypothetical protein